MGWGAIERDFNLANVYVCFSLFSCPKNKKQKKKSGEKAEKFSRLWISVYVVTCSNSLSSVSFPYGFRRRHYSINSYQNLRIQSHSFFIFLYKQRKERRLQDALVWGSTFSRYFLYRVRFFVFGFPFSINHFRLS